MLRLFERPELLATVRGLSPAVLHKVILDIGLEDSAELLALTTTEQLLGVFDSDLWANERPGEAERFDGKRFGVWLEVMSELGDRFVAQKLAELDEELLLAALATEVLVLRSAALSSDLDAGDVDEIAADKLLESGLVLEIEGYLLVARQHDAWDAWSNALLALDRDQHALLARLFERLANSADGEIEEQGGLLAVLSTLEQLEDDVAASREERRAEAGHIAPEQAKAFLRLCVVRPDDASDPISTAYFRALRDVAPEAPPQWVSALPRLANHAAPLPRDTPLGRAIAENPDAYVRDLAFLANVLLVGHAHKGRRLRAQEAALAAFAFANDAWPAESALGAFKRAWAKHSAAKSLAAFIAAAIG